MDGKLFNLDWQKYLALLFLLLGAGFFSSGVVSWIAANWDYFSKFQKLYATQFWLTTSLVLALVFYFRESKRLARDRVKTVSSIFFFITAVFVGALFALIGQIYQTGANAWELFALWSAFQIPLLLILPNVGSALLLAATLNVTLGLYSNTFHLDELTPYLFMGLNLFFVILSEKFYRKLHDDSWRIVSKIANIMLAVCLFAIVIDLYSSLTVLSFLISIICIIFYRKRLDLFPLTVHFTTLVINFDFFLLKDSYDAGTVMIAILLALGAFIFGVLQLKKLFFIRYPHLEISSVIQVIFTISALFITVLIFALIHLLRIDNSEAIFIISITLFGVALFLHYKKSQNYFVDLLMAISMLLAFLYFLDKDIFRFSSEGYDFTYAILTMGFYAGLIYYFKSTYWLRTLAVSLFVIAFLVHFKAYNWDYLYITRGNDKEIKLSLLQQFFSLSAEHWLMFGSAILFYFRGEFSNMNKDGESKVYVNITPVAWSFALLAYGTYLTSSAVRWFDFSAETTLPSVNSFSDLFNVLTNNIFLNLKPEWWVYNLFYFSVCLLPLIFFLLYNKRFFLKSTCKWVVSAVLLLFSISFVATNVILFCFALLLVAYMNSSRVLFAIAMLFLIKTLSLYYYWLAVPLLYKSFLLLTFGVIFFAVAILLYRSFATANKTEAVQSVAINAFSLKLKMVFSLITLIIVLAIANYTIIKYEDVLNNGKPIIVKLAPVDPRSLMQGDYMALNYEILTQFQQQFYGDGEEQINALEEKRSVAKVYALVKAGEKNVANLCRVELSPPTNFTGCQEGVYLPINTTNSWNPTLPSHSYFFAEGKGAYYAQAEYGEYRFKGGKALLFRLLDKNLKPL